MQLSNEQRQWPETSRHVREEIVELKKASDPARLWKWGSAGSEWDYLHYGLAHSSTLLVFGIGLLIIVLEPLVLALLDLPDSGIAISALGFGLIITAGLSVLLSRKYPRTSGGLLATGVTAAILLAALWWPQREMLFLLAFALLLWLQRLGMWGGLGSILLMALILLTPLFQPLWAANPGQITLLFVLMGTIWAASAIDLYLRSNSVNFLYDSYRQAQIQLRTVREHRMVLDQTNEELADAYVEIQRLNKLLQASRIESETARRSKEDFVANVSHELRTPLNMIIGFTEMIMNSPSTYGDDLPRSLLSDIRVIYRNSQHLSQMINDVLDLSRVDAGQLALSREDVDLHTLLAEAIQAVRPLYKAKGLSLSLDAPEYPLAAFCDKLRVRQILLNLLSNAGRFTDRGGVTVRALPNDSQVIFTVTDTGRGIPPQDREHLFEPFYQSQDVGNMTSGGSGLGLTICKKLVELHGGKIWLEEMETAGTSISFSVPVRLPGVAFSPAVGWLHPYSTVEPRQHVPMPKLPKPKDRFVVLEKEEVLQRKFAALLADTEIIGVKNLDELQREVKRLAPTALIINDVDAMEDKRYSQRFQSLPERIPVISCYMPGRQEAVEKLNVVEYLVKPIARTKLLAAIDRAVPAESSILIVENELEMALLIRRQLENADRGYRIIQVADGVSALQTMRDRLPDLVLLDLALADQDGHKVLYEKNLDTAIQNIPVIVISARDPVGEPVTIGRLRVELVGGLSSRDIVRCADAVSRTFSSIHRSEIPAVGEMSSG